MYEKLSDRDYAEFCMKLSQEFMNIPENTEVIRNVYEIPMIPKFEPHSTVLYSSYAPLNVGSRSQWIHEIQKSAEWLYCHGFYNYVVNSGCDFGLIALKELLKLRDKKNYNITVYAGRLEGHIVKNNAHSLIHQVVLLCESKNFGVHTSHDFYTQVVQRSGAVVTDKGCVVRPDMAFETL